MINDITISIASYRDPDLLKTVLSCLNNSINPDNIYFSIFSQADDNEHPDLSFIKKENLVYNKVHYSKSKGACWARYFASSNIRTKYFLQIDSHSRFKKGWDEMIISAYCKSQSFWGKDIIFTNYPDPFEINWDDGSDNLIDYPLLKKLEPFWDKNSKMIQAKHEWSNLLNTDYGDEVFFMSANSLFCESRIFKSIPYDPLLYFTGEEPSMALRAYTRGIKMISPTVKYMYTNYNRENQKRRLHWEDIDSWWLMNKSSYERLAKIMTGDMSLGIYGIGSYSLFEEYQNAIKINLVSKFNEISSI